MKPLIHHLRIPTKEAFAYIETDFEGTAEEAHELYQHLTAIVKGESIGQGIDNKTFLGILDELWEKESISGDPGMIEEMSHSQQEIVRAIKLIIKRAKSK